MYILISIFFLFFTNENSFEKSVHSYLSKKLTDYEKFEFELHRLPSAGNNTTIRLVDDNTFKLSGNLGYIPAEIVRNGRSVSTTFITVRLKLYQYSAVALRDIQREEVFEDDLFKRELVEVSAMRIKPLDVNERLLSSRAKQFIKAGNYITDNMIESIPLVQKGEKISALSIAGSVVVSIDAVSREDGSANDIIRIVAHGNKHFRAKVIDRFTVEIIE